MLPRKVALFQIDFVKIANQELQEKQLPKLSDCKFSNPPILEIALWDINGTLIRATLIFATLIFANP